MAGLNELRDAAYANAREHGWWKGEALGVDGLERERRGFPEVIALIHSEATEALEAWRDGHPPNEMHTTWISPLVPSKEDLPDITVVEGKAILKYGTKYAQEVTDEMWLGWGYTMKPEGVPSEFADIIIRVLDACGAYGIDIEEAVQLKMEYNRTRPFKNGRAV
jgi:NTP pyrophosphatase (non-canonical NTP hydrolase)